jgi:hypothetical protein
MLLDDHGSDDHEPVVSPSSSALRSCKRSHHHRPPCDHRLDLPGGSEKRLSKASPVTSQHPAATAIDSNGENEHNDSNGKGSLQDRVDELEGSSWPFFHALTADLLKVVVFMSAGGFIPTSPVYSISHELRITTMLLDTSRDEDIDDDKQAFPVAAILAVMAVPVDILDPAQPRSPVAGSLFGG